MKLGAASVTATDGDKAVLSLAAQNAKDNLGAEDLARFHTAVLRWGPSTPTALHADIVLGADITYSRDAWPALAQTMRALRAPVLLAASERRPQELTALRAYLDAAGLRSELIESPMAAGYAAERVKLLWIERPGDERCTFWTEEDAMQPSAEPLLAVKCEPPRRL